MRIIDSIQSLYHWNYKESRRIVADKDESIS